MSHSCSENDVAAKENDDFCPKVRILLKPFHDGRFSKCSHFSNIYCFFLAVFFTKQLEIICRMDFQLFFGILIFDSK